MWQGFIKCCEVTKPHSFQVLLKLPVEQLQSILEVKVYLARVEALVVILCVCVGQATDRTAAVCSRAETTLSPGNLLYKGTSGERPFERRTRGGGGLSIKD